MEIKNDNLFCNVDKAFYEIFVSYILRGFEANISGVEGSRMKVKYLIIGAGISGLSFVSNLNSEDYIIIEKESVAGGLCRTNTTKGYIWDYAGHFFHFRNQETQKYFEPVLGDEKCINQVKNTKIYFNKKYVDYPFQKNIHQLNKSDFIDCLYYLFFKEEKEEYDSFKEMLLGKFGKGICDRFLIPYNEKLYACDLNTLDQDAMGRFFPYADIEDIIKSMKKSNNKSYNDVFTYPYGGAQTVIKYLLKTIDKEKLHLNETALKIDLQNSILYTSNGVYEYEFLINTIPFNEFHKIIGLDINEVLSWNKVLVFNIGFDKPSKDKDIHWIYYPDKDINFYRVGFYNNILQNAKLSIYVEIGFDVDDIIDEEEQFELTLKNLKKCGIIDKHKVEAYESIIMNPAYVHISKKSQKYVENIREWLKTFNIFSLGRYGAWTYCSMEDCFISAQKLSKKLELL